MIEFGHCYIFGTLYLFIFPHFFIIIFQEITTLCNFLFQSPLRNTLDIHANANVWAVPCDSIPDCEEGVDEHPSRCDVSKKITASFLFIGYGTLFLIMLGTLIYNQKK